MRLLSRPERAELTQGVGKGPLRLAEGCVDVELARRHGLGERATLDREVRIGGRPLVREARPVAIDCLEVACQPGRAELEVGEERPRRVVGLAARSLGLRPLRELRGNRRSGILGGLECAHRPVGLGPFPVAPDGRLGGASGRLVPAGVGGDHQGLRELLACRQPGRLLLGLRGEPACLGSELGDDVLDTGEVRLRFGELILGLATPPLVPADTGNLLEERPALLGPECQCLIDHPLPDEQERVVGEVPRVEQVDEIAQPDALLVEQVVVLARSIESPAQLEDAEVDREQPVGVVEDERHVRHAQRRPLVGSGEDHVLGLAAAQGTPLLPEGPAQRVGEVALPRAVGTDDRADPAAELDDRPLGERLEALEPESYETRGGAHPTSSACGVADIPVASPAVLARSARSDRMASSAWPAAAVSAVRRDGPSPRPSRRSSTQTSIRNSFS